MCTNIVTRLNVPQELTYCYSLNPHLCPPLMVSNCIYISFSETSYYINQYLSVFMVHLPVSLSALQTCVSALEEELCAKAATMKSIQNEMVQSKKELATRELSIQKARDELSLAHMRMAQESERVNIHYC